MIAGIFHEGSGCGNQLHRYIATRLLAEKNGYEWGMINPEKFKGGFLNLDLGKNTSTATFQYTFHEKQVIENGLDIRSYDPEYNFIKDHTVLDGEFQDERYFGESLDKIRSWIDVEPLNMPDDLCIINFRGGEYSLFPELFLPHAYWNEATRMMREKYPEMRFQVHTDDPQTAQSFFPKFDIVDNKQISHSKHTQMALNWRSIRYAKHLILSNSSFSIIPALLNEGVENIIAPRYWARYNEKRWALPQNYYKKFTYLHHEDN